MLIVSRKSLPGQIYASWEKRGGLNEPGYCENLCHFVRVLVLWAPLFFLFKQPLGHRNIRPWMVGLIGLATAVFLLWPHETMPSWPWIVAFALINLVSLATAAGLTAQMITHEQATSEKVAYIISAPVWIPLLVVGNLIIALGAALGVSLIVLEDLIRQFTGVLKALFVMALLCLFTLGFIINAKNMLMILGTIVLLVVACVIWTVIVMTLMVVLEAAADGIKNGASNSTTLQIIKKWVMARKDKICPYIEVTN